MKSGSSSSNKALIHTTWKMQFGTDSQRETARKIEKEKELTSDYIWEQDQKVKSVAMFETKIELKKLREIIGNYYKMLLTLAAFEVRVKQKLSIPN